MKLKADKESDAIYLRIDDSKIVESEEVEKNLIIDYNESGNIVGIEILHVSQRTNQINFNSLQFETV
jgi:uncharacterized protein YuzE